MLEEPALVAVWLRPLARQPELVLPVWALVQAEQRGPTARPVSLLLVPAGLELRVLPVALLLPVGHLAVEVVRVPVSPGAVPQD